MRLDSRLLIAALIGVLAAVPPVLAANGKEKKEVAAKPASAVPAPDDLSVGVVRHVANCPAPKSAPCVIRKPVDVGYRILSAAVDLDDQGQQWVGDFAKSKNPVGAKTVVRVLGRDGDQHEIEVFFSQAAQSKATAPSLK